MMAMMNLFSSALMITYLFASPYLPYPFRSLEGPNAIQFVLMHPSVLGDIALFAVCGAIGQCFIFHTLEKFGAVALVMVTVTRKMFSILLSAFWFGHKFNFGQWVSISLVFIGIGFEGLMKQREDRGKVKSQVVLIEKELKGDKKQEKAAIDKKKRN